MPNTLNCFATPLLKMISDEAPDNFNYLFLKLIGSF